MVYHTILLLYETEHTLQYLVGASFSRACYIIVISATMWDTI